MKLDRLDAPTLTKAVAIYLDQAYGGGVGPRSRPDLALPNRADWQQVLGVFQREVVEGESQSGARYSLRLGNRNYPFMKLVLQEHLIEGEFYFAVDTHDEMEIRPDYPDYQAWMAVRRFNHGLKRRIEAQLAAEGLDTPAAVLAMAAAGGGSAPRAAPHHRILLVDDEEDLALAIENLLRAKGYGVIRASDGAAAVGKAEESLPDLVLLDYELPEMDGLEVIAALRSRERTNRIPVLLATAGRISLEDIRKADGFLAKPFQAGLLYRMVERLLAKRTNGNS